MSKISELGRILGDETASDDLFVTVNIAQGEDGTKNITRKELVRSIQNEIFTDLKVDGGNYINNLPLNNVTINNSTLQNSQILDSDIRNSDIFAPNIFDPEITVSTEFTPEIDNNDYFYLRDITLNKTVAISYSQFYDEIANTAKKANKVYVAAIEGNDEYPGSYLKPVATLEKAIEMAWAASEAGIPTAISVLPGDHYTNGNLALPDLCSVVSTNGQYSTKIIMNTGYEVENCFLLGSGCYVQGFSFSNLRVDNFDYPTKGFAFAFRPGVRIIRSPYIRDSSQISNYFAREIPPLLNPTNSKNTIDDLGFEIQVTDVNGVFEVGDSIETDNGVTGFISRVADLGDGLLYIRNNIGHLEADTQITSSSGGTATIAVVGEEDFPNKEVGRGGGMILADRAQVDQDSIFPYILAFGATPRTQNGLGYVAKNGAGINGISSLSIFARCSFYALDGGQITLNNSGTQFGDISMRAKGSNAVFNPRETSVTLVENKILADTLVSNSNAIIDDLWDYLTLDLEFASYNSEKCKRDVGYILEGVGYDIALGTNYWSIVNGIAYRRADSTVVVGEQLTETSGAINYLRDTVADLLSHAGSISRSSNSFDEIVDILVNGTASADSIIYSSTGNADFDKARALLVANKTLIQNDLIAWINSNYPDLVYNEVTCRRDTGFIVDALAHDLNYNANIATILNAEAYFSGAVSQLPLNQREPTAAAIDRLGIICSTIMLGTYPSQDLADGIVNQAQADKCLELSGIIANVIAENSLGALPKRIEPNLSWVDTAFKNSKEVISENVINLQKLVIAFVNSEYDFLDEALTRRDANNLITSLSNDFRFGRQTGTRIFSAGLFNYKAQHVFSVFNPTTLGLKYVASIPSNESLPVGTPYNIKDAIIVYGVGTQNIYNGTVYYWNGSSWIADGPNDVSLLNAFTDSWTRMKTFITNNYVTTGSAEETMLNGLFEDVLELSVINPVILRFGSLVESLSHQFNLASAGVNVNALPLNFRRLGRPISAAASVLQEEGGRVRWSGADELNNQYFARGLKINGRTGRLEGRPFTSSVRKLARRASNSRASV